MRPRRLVSASGRPLTFTVRRMLETHLDTAAPQHYYSPWQITMATLIGGPLAGGYLASRDHAVFGAPGKGRRVLIVSCIAIIGLIYLGSILPDQTPRAPLALLVAAGYHWYATYAFASGIAQRRSDGWIPYSWSRTVGLSLAFLLGSLLMVVIAVFGLKPS